MAKTRKEDMLIYKEYKKRGKKTAIDLNDFVKGLGVKIKE